MSAPASPHGYVVVGRGLPAGAPYAAGQIVDIYPLGELLDLTPAAGCGTVALSAGDAHKLARRYGDDIHARRKQLREIGRLTCPCTNGLDPPTLAVAYAVDGRTWVQIAAEKIPKAATADRRSGAATCWPLHSDPGGPHLEPTACRRCRRSWLVALTGSGMRKVDVSRPAYSSRVTD